MGPIALPMGHSGLLLGPTGLLLDFYGPTGS